MTEADKKLKDMCEALASNMYSGSDYDVAIKRLDEELSIVRELKAAQIFLNLHNLKNRLNLGSKCIIARGIGGASIIAYLLGISSACPIRHNLPIEFVFGLPPYKHTQLDISIPMSAFCELDFLEDDEHLTLGRAIDFNYVVYYKACHYDESGALINETRILGDDTLDEISEMAICNLDDAYSLTAYDLLVSKNCDALSKIPYFDIELSKDLLHIIKPKSLREFARVFGYVHNTYSGPVTDVLKEVIDYRLPASRDELFRMICDLGLDRSLAYQISDSCAKGRVFSGRESKWTEWESLLRIHGATDHFVHMCKRKVRYLFPECHNLNFAIKALIYLAGIEHNESSNYDVFMAFDKVFANWRDVIEKMKTPDMDEDAFTSSIKPMWIQTISGNPIAMTIIIPDGMDSVGYDRCYKSAIISKILEVTGVEVEDVYFITESDMNEIYKMYDEEEKG